MATEEVVAATVEIEVGDPGEEGSEDIKLSGRYQSQWFTSCFQYSATPLCNLYALCTIIYTCYNLGVKIPIPVIADLCKEVNYAVQRYTEKCGV